eukprot:2573333-Pyramimonas_sp.AAC.1
MVCGLSSKVQMTEVQKYRSTEDTIVDMVAVQVWLNDVQRAYRERDIEAMKDLVAHRVVELQVRHLYSDTILVRFCLRDAYDDQLYVCVEPLVGEPLSTF